MDDENRTVYGGPPQPVAPRSVAAAVLLNLTGLALGHAYLRRRLRAVLHLAGTVLLVAVAFLTDAAGTPWLWRVVAAAWLVWMALDAWRLARRTPQPASGAPRVVPAVVGVVAVLAVVGGYVGYGAAGRATFADGAAAQARADCAGAVPAFDAVTGPYELTLSRDVPAAAQRRSECVAFTAAERAERSGDPAGAVAAYQAFRTEEPTSTLAGFVHPSLLRVLGGWAADLRGAGDLAGEIGVRRTLLGEAQTPAETAQARADLAATYLEQADRATAGLAPLTGEARVANTRSAFASLQVVGQEFADTPSAAVVPQRTLATFTAANALFAAGRFCDALPVLDLAVTLPPAATGTVVPTARANRGQALYGCGLAEFRASHWDGALTQLNAFMKDHPNDPAAPQALALIIAAQVGQEADVPLPVPAPVDGNSPGSVAVVYYNLSPYPVDVKVAGPTAHTFSLPPCAGCPATYPGTAVGCAAGDSRGRPSVTLRLRAGEYRDLASGAGGTSFTPITSVVAVRGGFTYDVCLRIKAGG